MTFNLKRLIFKKDNFELTTGIVCLLLTRQDVRKSRLLLSLV